MGRCAPLDLPSRPRPKPPPASAEHVAGEVHDHTPIAALTKMRVDVWRRAIKAGGSGSYWARFRKQSLAILHAIEFGAPVDFEGDRTARRTASNHTILPEHEEKVQQVIEADVSAGKKAGPIPEHPWPHVRGHPVCVSPIGAVLKKWSTKIRVIHDLSFPKLGDSINAGIYDGSLDIASFGHAARAVVKLGRGSWLIKLDVEAAYKQVPVRPEDWHLLGFKFRGKLYYERVLPFGLRSSCRLWELFAAALHFMCEELNCGVPHEVVHYVDDFLFVVSPAGGEAAAARLLEGALFLCAKLGVPMAPDKVEGPSRCLTFLGIELDAEKLEARLPEKRLTDLHSLIVEWESWTHATIKQLQSLTGLLNFACACVLPGRVYTRRIINFTTRMSALKDDEGRLTVKPRHTKCALSPAVKADVAWWREFIQQWNGVSLLYDRNWVESDLIELFTDACDTGFGGYYAGHWIAGAWSPEELDSAQRAQRASMPFLELRSLVLAAATWGHLWRKKKITFRSDCGPVVSAIQARRSRTEKQMHQLRTLDGLAARHGFEYRAIHIAGEANKVADVLSRFYDCDQFRALRPNADQHISMLVRPPLPTADDL